MKTNTLFVIWSLGLGGAEQIVINLALGLDKEKFNVTVCCLNEKGVYAHRLEKNSIKVVELKKKGKFDLSIIGKLKQVMIENNIHVVNTHLFGSSFWGRIAAWQAKVPVIIATEHNTDVWKSKYHLFLDRLLSRITDKIIVVSRGVEDFYTQTAKIPKEKFVVVHNGITISNYQYLDNAREEFKFEKEDIVLGIVGRLVPQKGHKTLLLAASDLLKKRYKIKVLIVGSGELEEELKSECNYLQMQDNVIFAGFRKDIPKLLQSIDILVMPSLREGLPVTMLEAMASKIPVIATKVGGNPEVITNDVNGILIDPKNEDQIVENCEKLINDHRFKIQLIDNAYKNVCENFTIEKMVNNTQDLFLETYLEKERKRVNK